MNTLSRMVVCVALALVGLLAFVVNAYMGHAGRGVTALVCMGLLAWLICPSIEDMDACVADARRELNMDD